MASQNFVQSKITYEWRDVRDFFQGLDGLLKRLASQLFEIVRIRCFEDMSQDRTNSQALPVGLIEWSQHQFEFINRTDADFVKVKERSKQIFHAGFGNCPGVIIQAGREKQCFNDRQLDLWNGLSVQLVK